MIIKCPKCGIEYSYGRNLCHVCNDNIIFFGSLFNRTRKSYKWNCEDRIAYTHNFHDIIIDTNGSKEITMEDVNSYQWNCMTINP